MTAQMQQKANRYCKTTRQSFDRNQYYSLNTTAVNHQFIGTDQSNDPIH